VVEGLLLHAGCLDDGQEPGGSFDLMRQPLADQVIEHLRYLFIALGILVAQRTGCHGHARVHDLQVAAQQPQSVADSAILLLIPRTH